MPSTVTVPTNSYTTVAESDTYHDDSSHGATWAETEVDDKIRAKLTAFRMIERQDYKGDKVGIEKWPRTGLTDEEGIEVPSGSVPQFVKNAQFELELEILLNPSVQTNDNTDDNIKRLKAGTAAITKFRPTSGPRFPTIINEYLGRYLEGEFVMIQPFAGGTDVETGISTYELNRGY